MLTSPSLFIQPLDQLSLSPEQLIKQIERFSPCLMLRDQENCTIGLFPNHYSLFQHNSLQHFERSSNYHHYIPTQQAPSIELNEAQIEQTSEFRGGVMGFISYDYAAQQHISVNLKPQPALFLGIFKTFLKQTVAGWEFHSLDIQAKEIYQYFLTQLSQNSASETPFKLTQKCLARWSKAEYSQAFHKIQDYIVAGDCYQINLTQEFIGTAQGRLSQTAEAFWDLTQAPYSAYLSVGEFELLSCSPELFIEFQANRKILTKPIKGTMPRFEDFNLDEQSKQKLKDSEKDMAENVMIVDLLRNDLSLYAETGSVKTPKLFNIESFNQVHHMVSEIEATLKPNISPFDVLMSALPGGSITGAPKIRAMQIIEELEESPRGAYCGSLGYFNFDGTGSWNILIRSIQKYQEHISLWAGGGITIASDCDAEYQECFDKIEAMLNLLNTWSDN